ncbi:MAG: nucleotidyltransferase domain-containing protein [Verrucomicrobia bacterium]|nr:nucleotidyltransferase domain-containing protein [Verrucomicrobiota bacterium]
MRLDYDLDVLRRFCRERGIAKLELFGSALRDDFRPDSDVDLLCTLRPDAHPTLFGWVDMEYRLAEIFGRSVDLLDRPTVEKSRNVRRKSSILSRTEPLYVEG